MTSSLNRICLPYAVLIMVTCSMRRFLPCTVFKRRQEVISNARAVSLLPYYNIGLKLQKRKEIM